MGRYKSYLTGVQNEGGGVKATFGQCPKERRFFMASLSQENRLAGRGYIVIHIWKYLESHRQILGIIHVHVHEFHNIGTKHVTCVS